MKRSFCWECGLQLWGNKFAEVEVHGNKVKLHKECAKDLKRKPEVTAQDIQTRAVKP